MCELEVGTYFLSNDGAGPLSARLLWIAGDTARMKRWRGREYDKSTKVVYFELPVRFLSSKKCGWKQIEAIGR